MQTTLSANDLRLEIVTAMDATLKVAPNMTKNKMWRMDKSRDVLLLLVTQPMQLGGADNTLAFHPHAKRLSPPHDILSRSWSFIMSTFFQPNGLTFVDSINYVDGKIGAI